MSDKFRILQPNVDAIMGLAKESSKRDNAVWPLKLWMVPCGADEAFR